MQRVMIIGQPGAGKSTLARALGKATGLPVVHIDLIHWKPGWVERDPSEKAALCREVHARSEWIFEGGHSATYPERLARADTLIWIDIPVWLRLWRVTGRTLRNYGRARDDLPENCPERFSLEFFRFIWRTRRSGRARCRAFYDLAEPPKNRLHLKSLSAVNQWLAELDCHSDGK